ncbi:MAG: RHS repeat-associated core domain-containing protein [Myxococcota bacterium]|nr:RHS repeat-associated core domain-containing protein [Myxococcota bacterium]
MPHPALHQRVRVEVPTETTWSGPVAGNVARSFDDDFRVETESVNGGYTVTYEYDPDSLVTRVDQASGPELDLQRNAGAGFGAGLLTGTTQGVIATTETPSPFGELESLVATENSNPLYTLDVGARDALGRIETKIETLGAGSPVSTVYTYDAAGRLDTVTVDSTLTADYAYDANGNRIHEREDLAGPSIAVYDDQDRLLSYAGTSYTYSAAGDLETSTHATGTTTYGYDALGNLRSVVLPDGEQIEYGIDGHNRRVAKKVCPAPCTPPATPQPVQGFLYGDPLRIVAELDASNDVVSRFVYATRPNVPDFLVKDGTTYRILSDQVGSVRLVVNADTGAIAQRIDYDAFGNVLADTSPGFQPFGFAGGLMDPDTGLVRFGARDYDPRVGRWTSKDPIRFQGDATNLYGYSLADPVNILDSNGLWATTAEGYIPPGVPILGGLGLRGSLGYTGEGRFFLSFGAGVGYGASFTPFDPDGEPPGYADQCRGMGPGLNLSLIGSGGFGGGLAGIDASKRLGFGVDWSRGPSPYVFNETIPPDRNLGLGSNTNRVGLSGSATVNLTLIGK